MAAAGCRAKSENPAREMARIGARTPLDSFGIWMLGPALLKYGTEAQKKQYLPPIVRGEIRWCQGYSEPNAGSDLASLQTRVEDMGDHFIVNGQKVWTSYADKADWIFCLVRTDPAAPKHKGISFLLFDMATPGVSTRPILLISGNSPFCETFFDNVRVPKENLVGERDKGWDVAKYLLGHEREMISGMGLPAGRPLGQIAADMVGSQNGVLADPLLRADIARFDVDAMAFRLALERFSDMIKAGQAHPAHALDDEICRHRIEQAPPRTGDGRRRLGRARMGERTLARRRGRARMAAHQGQFDRRAAPARSSSASSPSAFSNCRALKARRTGHGAHPQRRTGACCATARELPGRQGRPSRICASCATSATQTASRAASGSNSPRWASPAS